MDLRSGNEFIVLMGRGYPTPESAVAALRRALEKDGITVDDTDIEPRRWTEKNVICPWEAVAQVPIDTIPRKNVAGESDR